MNSTNQNILRLAPSIIAMAIVILVSNVLVQIPIDHVINLAGRQLNMSELLTWGALTYPVAFLVTDSTNRIYGKQSARKVVYVGFALGVFLSLVTAFGLASEIASREKVGLFTALTRSGEAFDMLRIALASGSAFLIGQLLDITIFDKLRTASWWKAPTVSSFFGSLTDTAIFFSLAFAGTGLPWINWAMGDFGVKLLMVALLLYPFRLILSFSPVRPKIA
ncbi:MAG: queuosine precursor transporter [Pseudomonadota bacterium]